MAVTAALDGAAVTVCGRASKLTASVAYSADLEIPLGMLEPILPLKPGAYLVRDVYA